MEGPAGEPDVVRQSIDQLGGACQSPLTGRSGVRHQLDAIVLPRPLRRAVVEPPEALPAPWADGGAGKCRPVQAGDAPWPFHDHVLLRRVGRNRVSACTSLLLYWGGGGS